MCRRFELSTIASSPWVLLSETYSARPLLSVRGCKRVVGACSGMNSQVGKECMLWSVHAGLYKRKPGVVLVRRLAKCGPIVCQLFAELDRQISHTCQTLSNCPDVILIFFSECQFILNNLWPTFCRILSNLVNVGQQVFQFRLDYQSIYMNIAFYANVDFEAVHNCVNLEDIEKCFRISTYVRMYFPDLYFPGLEKCCRMSTSYVGKCGRFPCKNRLRHSRERALANGILNFSHPTDFEAQS